MFFKKDNSKLDSSEVVLNLLSFIINDENLSLPVYLPEIKSEKDSEKLGVAPIVYIWNEDQEKGSFSVSINGKAVAHLLEGAVSRDDAQFNMIRDEVMSALASASQKNVLTICQKMGAYPSEVFGI